MQHTREDVSRIRLSWAFCFYFILFCRFRLSDLTTSFSLIPKPLHQLHLLLPPLGVKLPDSSLSIFSDNTRNFYGGGTNSFSFNSLSLFICFSSSPIPSFIFFKLFPNPFSLKPISSRGFCFCLPKNANIPVINNNSSRRCRFLKASQSQSEDSASETDDEDETPLSKTEEEADQELPSRLESTISAYKEAILNGDEKSISDFEEIIHMVEKERNELLEKVSVLSDEIGAQKDKYVRLQADFDNFRKRTENEKLTIRSNAQGEVIESLLPMVDNFERAKQHMKLETEQEKKIDASYQGIYKQFVEIMKNLGVSVVPTVGTLFDPMMVKLRPQPR
nr:uncharacterized protein LOC113739968 [Coffea arabica]